MADTPVVNGTATAEPLDEKHSKENPLTTVSDAKVRKIAATMIFDNTFSIIMTRNSKNVTCISFFFSIFNNSSLLTIESHRQRHFKKIVIPHTLYPSHPVFVIQSMDLCILWWCLRQFSKEFLVNVVQLSYCWCCFECEWQLFSLRKWLGHWDMWL